MSPKQMEAQEQVRKAQWYGSQQWFQLYDEMVDYSSRRDQVPLKQSSLRGITGIVQFLSSELNYNQQPASG